MSSSTTKDVVVVSERISGPHPDVTYELLGKGREIAKTLGGDVHCIVVGTSEESSSLGAADVVHLIADTDASPYNSYAWGQSIRSVVEAINPRIVLVSTGTVGLDLCGSLGAELSGVVASYVVDLRLESDNLIAISQLYGGKLMAEADLGEGLACVSVVPGSFTAEGGKLDGVPRTEEHTAQDSSALMKAVGLQEPERGGVDITASELLVSVGRGIGGESNIEMVQELADALGVPLSASRPVIDQGWLPKAQQVGKSGKKVKPKVYLALGISGAPEHLEGMGSSELIIACNTDPTAPIFEVAHYGTTLDLFDLVPEMLDLVQG